MTYWVETELLKTLPVWVEKATSSEIKQSFENHVGKVKEQSERLEKIFEQTGIEPVKKPCEPMVEILRRGEDFISKTGENTMSRDAGLILTGQKIAHFEIASYGGLINLAKTIKAEGVPEILTETIQEEKAENALLYSIAESHINLSASDDES
jgi:ferritin-like metal-binding protein YciE